VTRWLYLFPESLAVLAMVRVFLLLLNYSCCLLGHTRTGEKRRGGRRVVLRCEPHSYFSSVLLVRLYDSTTFYPLLYLPTYLIYYIIYIIILVSYFHHMLLLFLLLSAIQLLT